YRQVPLIGLGFGMPFDIVTPMADISGLYSLWNVIPHNTLLWVPMRMGIPGMVGFWALIGMAVLEACAVMRREQDPLLRAVAVFAVAAIVAELMVAYGDLQLESYRNLVFLGALLGAVARVACLDGAGGPGAGRRRGVAGCRLRPVRPRPGLPAGAPPPAGGGRELHGRHRRGRREGRSGGLVADRRRPRQGPGPALGHRPPSRRTGAP